MVKLQETRSTLPKHAFVHDLVAIKKIMQANGIPDFTAPPPLKMKPGKGAQAEAPELSFADDIPDYDA